MKISFIIPVYNCKAYLPSCVGSIRAVNAEDYEILLIDDGSTDGSGAVCDELAAKFPEIRIVHQNNAGASAARNRGLDQASGDRVIFIDSDDTVDAEAMHAMIRDQRFCQADLILYHLSFDFYRKQICYRNVQTGYSHDGWMDKETWTGEFYTMFTCDSLTSACTKVFSREILERFGLRFQTDMIMYEDFEFVLRYMGHCDTIWNVPQAIYHYRQSEDEGNAGRRLKRIDSIPDFLESIESALQGLPETVSEADKATVLQQLHLVLAREKIAVSDIQAIQRICNDYRIWTQNRLLPVEKDRFQQLLLDGKAFRLYLRNKKTQLRHRIAVRVKAFIRRM